MHGESFDTFSPTAGLGFIVSSCQWLNLVPVHVGAFLFAGHLLVVRAVVFCADTFWLDARVLVPSTYSLRLRFRQFRCRCRAG